MNTNKQSAAAVDRWHLVKFQPWRTERDEGMGICHALEPSAIAKVPANRELAAFMRG